MASIHRYFKCYIKRFALWILLVLFYEAEGKDGLDVCKALNVFGRYGYYSVSMKVFPRNELESWLFREPVVDVLGNQCNVTRCSDNENVTFHGDFHMEFCDNVEQLMEAYFREFTIEYMDKPWRAFTASWSNLAVAKNFGVPVDYITNPYSYVFVRILRKRECEKVCSELTADSATVLPQVAEYAQSVQVGNRTSVDNFIKKYGSHFISSYTTGNSLYQVFVYHRPSYKRLKSMIQTIGIPAVKKDLLYALFSPFYAEHVGSILSPSGNVTLMNWAKSVLVSRAHYYPYSSLMRLYGNFKMLKELDTLLEDEALLSLHLKSLALLFKDPSKRNWFLEVLSNDIQLWEFNM